MIHPPLYEPVLNLEQDIRELLERRWVLQPGEGDIIDEGVLDASRAGCLRCDSAHRELLSQSWPGDREPLTVRHR
jgi:hypothetical protein